MIPILNKGGRRPENFCYSGFMVIFLMIGYYFRGRIKEIRHGMIGHHEGEIFLLHI